jgi:hypothetical protein
MMLWMVAAIGVFALVLLITAMRGPHKTLQRSAVKPRRHGASGVIASTTVTHAVSATAGADQSRKGQIT